MRNKRTNRFFSMVVVFAMMFTMMMPMGMVYAATITVNGAGGASTVVNGSTLQMIETNSIDVAWSVAPLAGGTATIDATTGLLTGTGVGTVTVIATAIDGSGIGTKTITVVAAPVKVTSITVTGSGGVSTVVNAGTLQMSVAVLPTTANDKTVNWSVIPGTGTATINTAGLLTGTGVGTVTVIATANDGSGIAGIKTITVIAPVGVSSISVTGSGGASTVLKNKTLAMSATILPTNATNLNLTWSVAPLAGGSASINPTTGVLLGIGAGTVTVRATATDGSGIIGSKIITVTEPVTSIAVTDTGAGTVVNAGTLQMSALISPADATNQSVTWSVTTLAGGTATINATTGLLTGTGVGTVTVKATAKDGSGIIGSKTVTVTTSTVLVTSITVTDAGAGTVVNAGTLQMSASVLPGTATNRSVTWSVTTLAGGTATINATGLLTGTGVGTVTVKATAKDGSGIIGSKTVTVTPPAVLVTGITVTDAGAGTVASAGTLQMHATILPTNATNPNVTWSVVSLAGGTATINATTGLLTGTGAGTVTVKATANDGSGIIGSKVISVITVPVTSIVVQETGADTVVNGEILQMNATILPTNATNQAVTWTVAPLARGNAIIDATTGALKGTGVGTVTVKATAKDGSGVIGIKTVTVKITPVLVTGITVTDTGSDTVVNEGTLQMSATILPTAATNKSVTWSVAPLVGGTATINATTGLLKGMGVGTVTVTATANDGSGIIGTKIIMVGAVVVTSITVTGTENAITVVKDTTLQMSAAITPVKPTEDGVTWSVIPGTGTATIDPDGLLTGTGVGTVTVKAMAIDGSGTIGTKVITVTAEGIAVTAITVIGKGGVNDVAKAGTLQMIATVLPVTATDLRVNWSLVEGTGTGIATIDAITGELKGIGVGTVTVKATANDGSGIVGLKDIMVDVPFSITPPILPGSSTVGVPVPIIIRSFGTKKGYVWNWTGITLEERDTTTAGTPTSISYTHTLNEENDMTITPTIMLNFGKTYTLTIPAGAVVDSDLNPNLAFSFVQVKPTRGVSVVAVDLVANDSSVSVDKVIKLTTNVPCTVDSNFPITLDTAGSIVTLAYVYDNNNIIVVPTEMLQGGTTYTLKIPAGSLKDSTAATNEASSISFTTAYNLSGLINNIYNPVNLNSLMAEHSPRGLNVNVPKRYLTKFEIAYSTVATNPLTNVDITAEDEVAKINVQFGTGGPTYQAIKGTTTWNAGYEGSLTTLDSAGQSIGQDIIFEALDQYGRLLERKTYIKLLVKGNKLDLSSTKKLNVTKTFADLILSSGKLLTDILKQYSLDELSLSVAS